MSGKLRYLIFAGIALGIIAIVGLTATTADSKLFEKWFPVLNTLNQIVTVTLFLIVITMIFRLWRRFKSKEFGAHLTSHLAALMSILAILPCLAIYIVSTGFISRSINSWFDVKVEKALESGVAITRSILETQQSQTETIAKQIAQSLASTPTSLLLSDLQKELKRHSGMEAIIFRSDGAILAAEGKRINIVIPDLPSPMQMQAVIAQGFYSVIDGDTSDFSDSHAGNLAIRVIVPIPNSLDNLFSRDFSSNTGLLPNFQHQQLYLQIIQPASLETTKNAATLLSGYRDYQSLVLSRASLQTIYAGTLTLMLLLGLFAAIAAALTFARRTIEPVLQLEKGTRQVADGNFQPIKEFPGTSEINVLTQSFNTMLREVSLSRTIIEEQRQVAEQAQAYLERILANISSGVLVLNPDHTVLTANQAALSILGGAICTVGSSLVITEPGLLQAFESASRHIDLKETKTVGFEYEIQKTDKTTPLYVKASWMPLSDHTTGLVLVFDDITQLMEVQRAHAWGEVARRLAHEIKNPLTPIRLAAERLEMKLDSKLSSVDDQKLLHSTISIITSQVEALQQMVNDFREYAKMPQAKLALFDLNKLLLEVADLYKQAGTTIILDLVENIPLINADGAQMRQVLHNLISNSVDAAEGDQPIIHISTREITRSNEERDVLLRIEDNGAGFSEGILSRAFEPYVTTKATGTGLGLPMIKKILDEHLATIQLSNHTDSSGFVILGARVDIWFRVPNTQSKKLLSSK